jgi:L-asparaginase / beta-aspartyl-peptidase
VSQADGIRIVESGRLRPPALIVHGGAGLRSRAEIDEPHQQAFRDALSAALAAGFRLLASGADAVTVAVDTVAVLEDSGALNAGRGSVRTSAGTVEMDAAVMDGRTRAVGAVAGAGRVRNPVRAAAAVLADDALVLLAGPAADAYALARGCAAAPVGWSRPAPAPVAANRTMTDTVGAVVVDAEGGTAAATSTGGVPGQIPGRVGDSPIAGAGLWADDRTCAVSGTGIGESFMRAVTAHHVHLAVRFGGVAGDEPILVAAGRAALAEVEAVGGYGGLIALAPTGDYAVIATTPLMVRGILGGDGSPVVRLFTDG